MRGQAAWAELNASHLFLAVTAHASLIITGTCCGRGGIVNIRYRWMHDQIERTHNLIMHHCIGHGTMVRTVHERRSGQDYLKRPLRRLCVLSPPSISFPIHFGRSPTPPASRRAKGSLLNRGTGSCIEFDLHGIKSYGEPQRRPEPFPFLNMLALFVAHVSD